MDHRLRATLIGGSAVVMWGALALLTAWAGPVPPFQLVAMTFAVAFLLALGKWLIRGENPVGHLRFPPLVFLFGVGGLFGYHFFYFVAIQNAPVVEASLIAYLWPLLIVLFSNLLPGERLRWYHLAGCLAGLAGCALLVTKGAGFQFQAQYTTGYLAAIVCALTWSSYSVLSRRFQAVPTDTVGWFCGGVAVLALIAHMLFETTRFPDGLGQWLAVLGLGLGPVGLAFFTWDHGMKRGHIQALGAFSYAAPLLSVLMLLAFGETDPHWTIFAATLAIVGGALIAARDMVGQARARSVRTERSG